MPTLPLRKRFSERAREVDRAPLKRQPVILELRKTCSSDLSLFPGKLDSALRHAAQKTGAAGGAIALNTGTGLQCRASFGMAPPVGTPLDPEAGLSGLCIRSCQPIVCADTEEDSRVDRTACQSLGIRSVLLIPLEEGPLTCGILELFSIHPQSFTQSHIAAVREIIGSILISDPPAEADGSGNGQKSPAPISESRFAAAGHSAWSRTVIAAGLVVAGVMFYSGKIRSFKSQPAARPRTTSTRLVPGPAAHPRIVGDDIVHTQARIQGTFSHSELDSVRARAIAGSSNAAYDLAERYADGAGVPRDYRQAMLWFERAGQKGNASAQWKLGLAYLKGIGVSPNPRQAAEWFIRAANKGHIGAQMALSELYFIGLGVPRDDIRAYTWATIAAETTNERNESLKTLERRMTAEQLADARHRVRIWWESRSTPVRH